MAFSNPSTEDLASTTASAAPATKNGVPVIVVQNPDPANGDNAVKYAAENAARLPRLLADAQDALGQAKWLPNSDPQKANIVQAASTMAKSVRLAQGTYLDVSGLTGTEGAAVLAHLESMFDGTLFKGSFAQAQKCIMNTKYELIS